MNNIVADAEELDKFGDFSDEVQFNYSFLFIALVVAYYYYFLLSSIATTTALVLLHTKAAMMVHYAKSVPGAKVKAPCANDFR